MPCFWTDIINAQEECDDAPAPGMVLFTLNDDSGYSGGRLRLYVNSYCGADTFDDPGASVRILARYLVPYDELFPTGSEECGREFNVAPYMDVREVWDEEGSWAGDGWMFYDDWSFDQTWVLEVSINGAPVEFMAARSRNLG